MPIKKLLVCAVLLFFGGILIAFPQRYLAVCFDGLCLWAECVLPSLFPFMVISLLLIKLGAAQAAAKPFVKISGKLKLPPAALPLFFMSVCSGYPAGSRILCEYYESGLIDESATKKLAPLCSTCGPLFALGTVGAKAFGGGYAGVKLFCACLISVIGTSLLFSAFGKPAKQTHPLKLRTTSDGNALYSVFYGAVTASLVAGGFICFFYTLSKVFADFSIFKPLELLLSLIFGGGAARGVSTGLCEATGGCFLLAQSGGFFALPLAGFLITFGGASILLQQLCYLTKCKVGAGYFIIFKFVQGVIAFALICLLNLL
ncbi:MAG: hypothetical protein K2L72_02235 [Clostridia bacterium]|nr:hypothetical protein [Clostridia bacterium]